jgi:SAM-dependent methyltransferase
VKNVPADYYRRLHEADAAHWWSRGMRGIEAALLGDRLGVRGQSLLDAGCGTGGFLAWASGLGSFERLCGTDVSPEAIELAREVVPGADLRVAPLHRLPFDDATFDVAVLNDVLQHVREDEVGAGLGELGRALRADGVLLVRTNGVRHARREREDWRAYDAEALAAELRRGGFRVLRLTYANMVLSLWAAVLGRAPTSPTSERDGIPEPGGAVKRALGSRLLAVEARYLAGPGRRLPYGHNLLAMAVPRA